MKQNIDVVIKAIDCCYEDLDSFIDSLREIWSNNIERYSRIYVCLVEEWDYNASPTLLIRGERLERDEEEAQRKTLEKLPNKMMKEEEYQYYLVLKKKYEKEENKQSRRK
jgi:hypothetical protein